MYIRVNDIFETPGRCRAAYVKILDSSPTYLQYGHFLTFKDLTALTGLA